MPWRCLGVALTCGVASDAKDSQPSSGTAQLTACPARVMRWYRGTWTAPGVLFGARGLRMRWGRYPRRRRGHVPFGVRFTARASRHDWDCSARRTRPVYAWLAALGSAGPGASPGVTALSSIVCCAARPAAAVTRPEARRLRCASRAHTRVGRSTRPRVVSRLACGLRCAGCACGRAERSDGAMRHAIAPNGFRYSFTLIVIRNRSALIGFLRRYGFVAVRFATRFNVNPVIYRRVYFEFQ